MLVYAILKSTNRFDALRTFTLESGQEEIERQNQRRKASSSSGTSDALLSPTISHSGDDNHGSGAGRRPLSHVPEDGTFAIGEDDSDEEEHEPQNTPSQSPSHEHSRAPSVASAADENVPLQLRGMSEKARGKMPASQVTFSRQNSTTSLSSYTPAVPVGSGGFVPTTSWVSNDPYICNVAPREIYYLLTSKISRSSPGSPSYHYTPSLL